MPTYRVTGAFRDNGEDTWITLTAATKAEASSRANGMGILVADVELAETTAAMQTPPTSIGKAPVPPQPPMGVAVCPLCRSQLRGRRAGPTVVYLLCGGLLSAVVIGGMIITPILLAPMIGPSNREHGAYALLVGWGIELLMLLYIAVRAFLGPVRMVCTRCDYRSNA